MTTDARTESDGDPRVVVVPGLSGDAADFSFLGPMLGRRRTVTTASFDDLPTTPTVAELTTRIGAAANATTTPPALIGYSVGAVAAAVFAAEHPERVSALVLIAGWLSPSPKLIALASLWQRLAHSDPDALAEVQRSALYSAEGWDSAALPRIDERSAALVRLAATPSRASAPVDLATLATRITAPTLVIGCAHDEIATARETRLLFAAIPDARYTEVESGHGVLRERPAEVLGLVDGFLAEPRRHPAGAILGRSRP